MIDKKISLSTAFGYYILAALLGAAIAFVCGMIAPPNHHDTPSPATHHVIQFDDSLCIYAPPGPYAPSPGCAL